jgi:outer membrane receptor protein involved in Fe transport
MRPPIARRGRRSVVVHDEDKMIEADMIPSSSVISPQRVWIWAMCAALACVAGRPALVVAQTATGAIQGTIADPQGGVLPGVTVTARSVETGVTWTTVSEADGRYRIGALSPGHYDLRAELQGFAPAEAKALTLTIGLEFQQPLTLGLQGVTESVTVSGLPPVVETTNTQVSAVVVTEQQIASLPIEARAPTSLSLLLPGTGGDSQRAIRPNANVGAGGIGIASTNYLADGMSNMISRGGDPRDNLPQSVIQEFKVITSQAPAEYGDRTGGVVSVVTKGGGNRFSGETFEYFRNQDLTRVDEYTEQAHDQTGAPILPFKYNQFGFDLGGPVIKDRLHYYGSFEHTGDQEFFTVNTGQPQFYSALQGTFQGGSVSNDYFGRADLEINPQQHLFARYFKQDVTYLCYGCGGTASNFSAGNTAVPSFTYVANHTWVVSPRILNELTAMYAESFNLVTYNSQYTPPQYNGVGSAAYVFPSASWGFQTGTQFHNFYRQAREALSINAGAHTLKVGAGVIILPAETTTPGNTLGTWTFATDQPFNPNNPASFAQLKNPILFSASYPTVSAVTLSDTYEAYAQDEWRPWSNLTLNLGARYSLQTKIWNEDLNQSRYPTPLPYVNFGERGGKNNVAPRLGFAWDVRHDGHTVVRGGYGIVYTNVQNGWLDGEITDFQQTSITIKNPSYPDPYQGRSPASFISTAPPNIGIAANNLVNPPAYTTNAGFSQELTSNLALHVDGIYTRTTQFPVSVQVNGPDPATEQVPLPAWGRITEVEPIGWFDYRALLVRLDKRFANRTQYMVAYTLAKQDNNWAGGSTNAGIGSLTNFYNASQDVGPADNDRRHTLVTSGSVLLPFDINLGAVWTLRSSLPFSALAGKDLNGDGLNTDYVPGTTRDQGNRDLNLALVNAWRAENGLGPISASQIQSTRYNRVDLRISKTINVGGGRKLELIGQIFDLFGTDNLGGIGVSQVTNALSNSFGRVLSALPRQEAELAVRFAW